MTGMADPAKDHLRWAQQREGTVSEAHALLAITYALLDIRDELRERPSFHPVTGKQVWPRGETA